MYIFYDIETTGTDLIYDQILQFGAVLVDDRLVEVDRFEMRCRLLPWVVPSPSALLVTSTEVERLDDPSLPDFYTMMSQIAQRLAHWGTAIFVGYNSMRFDEPFLQRAFWQALLPPYLTVTGGNSRFDLLPIVRAAAWLRPTTIIVPLREDGTQSFKLDALAPANGLRDHSAHDALGDVEATLFLSRKVADQFPELWEVSTSRASKITCAEILGAGEPVFVFLHGGVPPVACYFRVDRGETKQTHAVLARLDYDWASGGVPTPEDRPISSLVRRISLNKAPLIFSLAEARTICNVRPSSFERLQASYLANNPVFRARLCEFVERKASSDAPQQKELEESIFDGFASFKDQELMREFHSVSPGEQFKTARQFSDARFRRLAMRYLFVRAPEILGPRERNSIQVGIARRLQGENIANYRPRSIADAIVELESEADRAGTVQVQRLLRWYQSRAQRITGRAAGPMSLSE